MDHFAPGTWEAVHTTGALLWDPVSAINPALLPPIVLAPVLVFLLLVLRRTEIAQASQDMAELAHARETGGHKAQLQYPHIDLDQCLGCGSCVRACPEDGVLGIVHGQAAVVYGSRCVGHGVCAEACPVGAIVVTLGDVSDRKDIPSVTKELEAVGTPGLFLAGEVTGFALIRTGIAHGVAVVDEVAKRVAAENTLPNGEPVGNYDEPVDLCIIGAGPAGLAASLQAKARGLSFLTLERETLGGTVSKYPRRKLVMTQPVTLPCYGRLKRTTYSKEELIEIWEELARKYELPIRSGEEFLALEKAPGGHFLVKTNRGVHSARFVCLAIGRRGTPRKLGVPGEELPKVAYSLIDAQSYQGRRILVVGGGDSAVEAAVALSEQPANRVTISYRRSEFSRLKAGNHARIAESLKRGKVECVFDSEVQEIGPDAVRLRIGRNAPDTREQVLENDEVFVMAGGVVPFRMLEDSGVSFDPADQPPTPTIPEKNTDLAAALLAALALAVAPAAWYWVFRSYYSLSIVQRLESPLHAVLRSSGIFGLVCGVLASVLITANLAYLLRRTAVGNRLPGSLRTWMTSHVITGTLALGVVLIHAAIAPRHTVGGHAYLALVLLAITGVIGRYFYALVPRAINGKELELEQLTNQLTNEATQWGHYGEQFGTTIRRHIEFLVAVGRWRGGFFPRLGALLITKRRSRDAIRQLRNLAQKQGLAPQQIRTLLALAKRACWSAVSAAHHEDLRGLLASWRFFHRWVALLMILLAVLHIAAAVRYGGIIP